MKVEPNHLLKALRSTVEAIDDIFNPTERLEKQIVELDRKIAEIFCATGTSASKCADPLMEPTSDDKFVVKSLLMLPPELAGELYVAVNARRTLKIIRGFELEHDGTQIMSVRNLEEQE